MVHLPKNYEKDLRVGYQNLQSLLEGLKNNLNCLQKSKKKKNIMRIGVRPKSFDVGMWLEVNQRK